MKKNRIYVVTSRRWRHLQGSVYYDCTLIDVTTVFLATSRKDRFRPIEEDRRIPIRTRFVKRFSIHTRARSRRRIKTQKEEARFASFSTSLRISSVVVWRDHVVTSFFSSPLSPSRCPPLLPRDLSFHGWQSLASSRLDHRLCSSHSRFPISLPSPKPPFSFSLVNT